MNPHLPLGRSISVPFTYQCVKSVQIRSFSWSVFSCIYFVNLHIQSEYRKIWTRKNSVSGHFSRSDWLRFIIKIEAEHVCWPQSNSKTKYGKKLQISARIENIEICLLVLKLECCRCVLKIFIEKKDVSYNFFQISRSENESEYVSLFTHGSNKQLLLRLFLQNNSIANA